MSEATIRSLSTPLPNEEPFIGDGEEGELVTNTADGRAWVFDTTGFPVELGGACVNRPLGTNLFASNYLELDVTNPDNLPVPIPDPLTTPVGSVREIRVLFRFLQNPLAPLTTYFDYEVDWGRESLWNPGAVSGVENPIDLYSALGSQILIELTAFGPVPKWLGRVLWTE